MKQMGKIKRKGIENIFKLFFSISKFQILVQILFQLYVFSIYKRDKNKTAQIFENNVQRTFRECLNILLFSISSADNL